MSTDGEADAGQVIPPANDATNPSLQPFNNAAYEEAVAAAAVASSEMADVNSPPSPVTGAYTVINHAHDEEHGTYVIVVAKPVCIPAYGDNIETLVGYDDERDFVFADDDPRWFGTNGIRLTDDEIAAQQRAIIKQALTPNMRVARAAPVPAPRALPGVGDEL